MTRKQANAIISAFNGYGKQDKDFTDMFHALYNNGLSLVDGDINYSPDMTSKHYTYRVIIMKEVEYEDGYTQWEEAKTIGYLSAYKCFVRGLDNPFEILAYIA